MAKPSTSITSKSCTLGYTLALAHSWEPTQGSGWRGRALEAGCPAGSALWGFSKLCRWTCKHQAHHLLFHTSSARQHHGHISGYLSSSPEAPWLRLLDLNPHTETSTTTLVLDRNNIIHYSELHLHLAHAFKQLQGRPEDRRWHPHHSGVKRHKNNPVHAVHRPDTDVTTPANISPVSQTLWHFYSSFNWWARFLPPAQKINHSPCNSPADITHAEVHHSQEPDNREIADRIHQTKIPWFWSTCKRQFDLIRDHTAVLLRDVLSCLNPGFHVIVQQGLRQHYHSCSGICHNSPLPSWGLGKNRRLSEFPPYTCFEIGGEKRGNLAAHNERRQCCAPMLFYSLTSPVKRGRTLLFEQTGAQRGQRVGPFARCLHLWAKGTLAPADRASLCPVLFTASGCRNTDGLLHT